MCVANELAIIISYPTALVNNCFIKNALKIFRIRPDFICKNNRIQFVFNFEQTSTVTMSREHGIRYNGSYTMIAKPVRALELHSPMIQFLVIRDS